MRYFNYRQVLVLLWMLLCVDAQLMAGFPAIEELGTTWLEQFPAYGARLDARLSVLIWDEDARDLLGQINRTREQVIADWTPVEGLVMRAGYVLWEERPDFEGGTYDAEGGLLGARIQLLDWLSIDGLVAKKDYSAAEPADTQTGFLRIRGIMKDVFGVQAGWERRDEIHNFFNLLQMTQFDVWRACLKSEVPSRLTAEISAESGEGNDFNRMWLFSGEAGYVFPDASGRLRAILSGEIRNTKYSTFYLMIGEDLMGITYPYWTPVNYQGWGTGVDWRSEMPAAGARADRLDCGFRVLIGDDSEENPYARLEADMEWRESAWWSVGIRGILHQSREDDVMGACLELGIKW